MSLPTMLFLMILCHIIDDFCLQGILLSNLKQKSYWQKHAPDEKYKHDYIMALIIHSLSWSIMISLPIMAYYRLNPPNSLYGILITNAVLHAIVDHVKANLKRINLIHDQTIHMLQILLTFGAFALQITHHGT